MHQRLKLYTFDNKLDYLYVDCLIIFTQGFNGVHIARSLVSCFLGGGGGANPFISVHFLDRYFSGQWNFEGASCSKILLAHRAS